MTNRNRENRKREKPVLRDQYGRRISYARLALTDVCNLRCSYCMPENPRFCPSSELLTLEEWLLLIQVLIQAGIEKFRFTGGEPLASPIFMPLLTRLCTRIRPEKIHITTNATYLHSHLEQLHNLGIKALNISLDTLKAERFFQISRRNLFAKVIEGITQAIKLGFQIKINVVVMAELNADELQDFIELGKNSPLEIRFIEEQPFQGKSWDKYQCPLPYSEIHNRILKLYPQLSTLAYTPHSTAMSYQIPGYTGTLAIIPAFSRLLCHSCNRLRITPTGQLKTCLYSEESTDLRSILRSSQSTPQKLTALHTRIHTSIQNKPKDGFAANEQRGQKSRHWQSMNQIGG